MIGSKNDSKTNSNNKKEMKKSSYSEKQCKPAIKKGSEKINEPENFFNNAWVETYLALGMVLIIIYSGIIFGLLIAQLSGFIQIDSNVLVALISLLGAVFYMIGQILS